MSFIHKLALGFLEYKKAYGARHLNESLAEQSCGPSADDMDMQRSSTSVRGSSAGDFVGCSSLRRASVMSMGSYLRWLQSQNTVSTIGLSLATGDALLLRCEHWLEAADEHHRHGSNLRPYFDYWSESVSSDSQQSVQPRPASRTEGQPHVLSVPGSRPSGETALFSRLSVEIRDAAAAAGVGEASVSTSQSHARRPPSGLSPSAVRAALKAGPLASAAGGGGGVTGTLSMQRRAAAETAAEIEVATKALLNKKWEPAGGWQKVLEAVAACSMSHHDRLASAASTSSAPVSLSSSPKSTSFSGAALEGVGLGFGGRAGGGVSAGKQVVTARELVGGNRATRKVAGAVATGRGMRFSKRTGEHGLTMAPSLSVGNSMEMMSEDSSSSLPPRTPLQRPHLASMRERGQGGQAVSSAAMAGRLADGPVVARGAARGSSVSDGLLDRELGSEMDGSGLCGISDRAAGESDGGRVLFMNGDDEEDGEESMSEGESSVGEDEDKEYDDDAEKDSQEEEDDYYHYGEDMGEIDLIANSSGRGLSGSADEGSEDCAAAGGTDPSNNFFLWLDHGAGKQLDLAGQLGGVARSKLESERVIYLTPDELPPYEVVVDRITGKLMYKASGQMLHTYSIPVADGASMAAEGGLLPPPPAAVASATAAKEGKEGKDSKWIWVVGSSGRLYVHPKVRGKFHHSSFVRGSVVLAAGNMLVDHGRLVGLTADSGHYWPQPGHFRWFYERLKEQGADLDALQGIEFNTKH